MLYLYNQSEGRAFKSISFVDLDFWGLTSCAVFAGRGRREGVGVKNSIKGGSG
jgi:hypothetical protein